MDTLRVLVLCLILTSLSVLFHVPWGLGTVAEVYVSPRDNVSYTDTAYVGSKFNVTVWVSSVADLAGWQVQFDYDSTMLNATRVWQPNWDAQYVFYGRTTFPTASFSVGRVVVGDALLPWNQSKFSGSGKLCIVELQRMAKPQAGKELSCTLDISQGDFYTYLLDSNMNKMPITKTNGYYEYVDRHPPISSFNELFAHNVDVRFVYPSDSSIKPLGCVAAMVSDWTASAFLYVLVDAVKEGLDTDGLFVNQTTGRTQGSNGTGIISFGGPIVNPILRYAENASTSSEERAPVKFSSSNGIFSFQYANGTNIQGAQLNMSYINNDKDMFVIEVFRDRDGKYLLLCYGFGWKGTYAAGKYFYTVVYPSIQTHSESWIIVKWEDTNGDGFVNAPADGDSYTVIATGS